MRDGGEREIKNKLRQGKHAWPRITLRVLPRFSCRREKWDMLLEAVQERVVVFCLVGTA
jgi:hypothetical protein